MNLTNTKSFIILFVWMFLVGCTSDSEKKPNKYQIMISVIESGAWVTIFNEQEALSQITAKHGAGEDKERLETIQLVLESQREYIALFTSEGVVGDFYFLKEIKKGEKTHLLFGASSELFNNYFEFVLDEEDGNIMVADVIDYFTGERLTERIFNSFDEQKESYQDAIKPIVDAYVANQCDDAWAFYQSLSTEIQSIPDLTHIKIDVADCVSQTLGFKVREELINSTHLPQHSKALHRVELGRVKADPELLKTAIPELKKIVGEDLYLDQLLPKALAKNKKYDEALEVTNQLIQKAPDFEWAHFFKLDLYIFSEDYLGAKQWLGKIKNNFEIDSTYLASLYELHPELSDKN